jgi:dTDP-4-amino-4,6-dideoxygalactose transaminase
MSQTARPTLPLFDLKAQHRGIQAELDQAITRVFASGLFIGGAEVRLFEEEYAAYLGIEHVVACGNGTDALELALQGLGVGAGDEVVTVSMTFAATAEAIVRCGATPRFVDVDPDTLLMEVSQVEAALTSRTRVVIPVHLYGSCLDMAPLMRLAARRGLKVVEDAAQAHGAMTAGGARAGTTADAGCFSFYPGKNLGACGDAGAVVTRDSDLARTVRQASDHGQVGKYEHGSSGRNSRMDAIQGAILRAKLTHLDDWNHARDEVARLYRAALGDLGSLVATPPSSRSVYHQFVIRVPRRDDIRRALADVGIDTGIHYPVPVHQQSAFREFASEELPVTTSAAAEVLSLPMFPELRPSDVERVADALRTALKDTADTRPQG